MLADLIPEYEDVEKRLGKKATTTDEVVVNYNEDDYRDSSTEDYYSSVYNYRQYYG